MRIVYPKMSAWQPENPYLYKRTSIAATTDSSLRPEGGIEFQLDSQKVYSFFHFLESHSAS